MVRALGIGGAGEGRRLSLRHCVEGIDVLLEYCIGKRDMAVVHGDEDQEVAAGSSSQTVVGAALERRSTDE